MRHHALVVLLAIPIWLAVTVPAQPGGGNAKSTEPRLPLDAKPLIEHCWSISLEL